MKKLFALILCIMILFSGCTSPAKPAGDMEPVSEFIEYKTIAAGYEHNLAVKTDGSLLAWGDNRWGQLGDGTATIYDGKWDVVENNNKSTPVKIMDDVASVAAGWGYSYAIKTDGSLLAWGDNRYGLLGDGTTVNSGIPIKIMDNVRAIAAGYGHSLAITMDGSLWSWGTNYWGQLGDGTNTIYDDEKNIIEENSKSTPVKIMEDVVSVAAGAGHSFAVKTDGSLWAWGDNSGGQLGDDTTVERNTPVKIIDNVVSVMSGSYHSLAVKTDGSLWTWGENGGGQLGDGTTATSKIPIKIMDHVAYAAAGGEHSLVVKTDGSLWAWGSNSSGQLGCGPDIDMSAVPVKIMDNADSLDAGDQHSLAVKTDGSLWAWGANWAGQLGDGASITYPGSDWPQRSLYTGWYNVRPEPAKIMDGVMLADGKPPKFFTETTGQPEVISSKEMRTRSQLQWMEPYINFLGKGMEDVGEHIISSMNQYYYVDGKELYEIDAYPEVVLYFSDDMWKEGSYCSAIDVTVRGGDAAETMNRMKAVFHNSYKENENFYIFNFDDVDIWIGESEPDARDLDSIDVWFLQKGNRKPVKQDIKLDRNSKAPASKRADSKWDVFNHYFAYLGEPVSAIRESGVNITSVPSKYEHEVTFQDEETGVLFVFYLDEDTCQNVKIPPYLIFTDTEKVSLTYFKNYWDTDFYWGFYDSAGYNIRFDDDVNIYFETNSRMEMPIERKSKFVNEDYYCMISFVY